MLDCIVVCVAGALIFILVVGFIAIFRGIKAESRIGEKDQPDPGSPTSLKIPADCPKTDYDFIVDLECPDGTVVRVAIPIDAGSYEGRCSRTPGEHASPVGLNLVCAGHYT